MWRIYTKAGEKGWKIFIPIYNNWTFLRIGGQNSWWAIASLIPIINLVSSVMVMIAAYNIGRRFGKPGSYVAWYILFLPVWAIGLGFDKKIVWHNENQATDISPPPTPPYN